MNKIILLLTSIFLLLNLVGCSKKEDSNTIRVGAIAGPESQLVELAKKIALKKYGLHVEVVNFTDYVTPNIALANSDIDANAYQDEPFLEAQIKEHHYKFIAAGKTFLYPMGLYSKKIKALSQLKPGAKIAIPNDPSNVARALTLLQKAGLIKLKSNAGFHASREDIIDNPNDYKIVELDGPEIPRALDDVALAAINTTFVIPAGLSPKEALFIESTDSPHANLIVVRSGDQDLPKVKNFVASYQSQKVIALGKKLFGDAEIPAWKH